MRAPPEEGDAGGPGHAQPAPRTASLGRSGPEVTRLGLGLAALGRPGYINLSHGEDLGRDRSVKAMRDRAHEVLDAALASGICYFDAARSYGRAEEFLSSWLAARESAAPGSLDGVVVGSKWGYTYTAGWKVEADVHEVKDHSISAFRAQVRASRDLLGSWLRLYQVHSVTPESPALGDRALLEDLARLRDQGIAVGITASGPRQAEVVRRALEVTVGTDPLFSTVQATWNLLEPSAGAALAEAHREGVGVILKEVLANGRLGPRGHSPITDVALRVGRARGLGVDAVAIAAALRQPWADVVLSGAANLDQLASNVEGLGISLDAETMDELTSFPEDRLSYWDRRSHLPWN